MTKGRANLLIIGLVAFLGTFAVVRLSGLSLWVSLLGAGATTAAMLSALMLATRWRGQFFQTRKKVAIFVSLLGCGLVANSIFIWYTTQLRAIAVIGLLSGITCLAGGVFDLIQAGRIDRKPESASSLGEQESK